MPLIPIGVILLVFALFKLVNILQILNKRFIVVLFGFIIFVMMTTHSLHPSQIYWYWIDYKPIDRILKSNPDSLFIAIEKMHKAWPLVNQEYNLVRSKYSYILTENELVKLNQENLKKSKIIIIWISRDLDQNKIEKRLKDILNIKANIKHLTDYSVRMFYYVYNN